MSVDPNEKERSEHDVKPARPQLDQDDAHVHPDQDRHEPEQDHHEHGNLPKRPGRPGTT